MEKLKGMCLRVTKNMKRDRCGVMKISRHSGVGCEERRGKCLSLGYIF